jgi:hypothetical protein
LFHGGLFWMTASNVITKNRSWADGMAEGYLILKIVMWVIELRYRFESHAKVVIQRQIVVWGGPPGREQARAGTAGEDASLGHWWAFWRQAAAPVCADFGIPGFQFAVPHPPDARVAPDATRVAMEGMGKRRVVGSVGSNLSSTPALPIHNR